MKNTLLTAALLAATSTLAHADPKPLETQVFTASPNGFLVDSTLVTGDKDAILIDAQFDRADAHRLVAQILESKKNLTTVFITHSHPDHYFGLEVIHQAFPKAKLVALPATVAEIKKTWQGKVKQWQPMFGELVPSTPVLPTALTGTTLTLDGETLEIHGGVQGDETQCAYVWIPSTKTVIAGDIVYRGVHVWPAETKAPQRQAWQKTLDALAALHPPPVLAGHMDPKRAREASPKGDNSPAGIDQPRQYLAAFDAAVASAKTSEEAQAKVKSHYKALQLDVILKIGADAQYAK